MNLAANGAPDPPARGESPGGVPARVVLLLFAEARMAAGTSREDVSARSVGELLDTARVRHGERFAAVLERARVWVNGDPVDPDYLLHEGDEVAVLPPVSGGARP
jgi:molybdopterin converting factor small subunit